MAHATIIERVRAKQSEIELHRYSSSVMDPGMSNMALENIGMKPLAVKGHVYSLLVLKKLLDAV